MSYQKAEQLYEGKGKKVFAINGEKNYLWLEYKDSLTAFNAQKLGSFQNKGAIGRDIASIIFRFLKSSGVESHWVQDIGTDSMICAKLEMIPLEVVVRNYVAGSFAKKFGLPEGEALPTPIVEFYYKRDDLNDPFISDDQALYLKAAKNQAEIDELKKLALKVNSALVQFFKNVNVKLIDFKLEYGRNAANEIRLGDEITPDSCRLWDMETNKKMDKDRFRQDLGGVAEGYSEILARIQKNRQEK